jgi:hypothetical protein
VCVCVCVCVCVHAYVDVCASVWVCDTVRLGSGGINLRHAVGLLV